MKEDVDQVTEKWLPGVVAVSEISLSASNYRILELSHSVTSDIISMRQFEKKMNDLRRLINQTQVAYEGQLSQASRQEQNIYQTFVRKWERYLELHERVIDLSLKNDKTEAYELLNGESQKVFDDFKKDLEDLVLINKESSMESSRDAEETYRYTYNMTVIIFIITLIIRRGITLFLIRAVTIPD